MQAVVMRGPNEYGVETVEIPRPSDGEALIRIKAVAICGSDPKLFSGGYLNMKWPPSFPFIPGHEFAGEVVALGNNVTGFSVGDRVAGEAHCGCGYCANCKSGLYNLCLNYGNSKKLHRHYGFTYQGAYAQYNAYNVKALTKMPDSVSYEAGSLVDTAGIAYHAISRTGITPGGYTLVIGPGPIGIFVMQIAKSMGSRTIMVGRRERLNHAKRLGADFAVDYEKCGDVARAVKEITGDVGADEAFECAGTQTAISQSVYCTRKNGKVAFISLPVDDEIPIPFKTVVMNQISVFGSRANPNVSEKALALMDQERINAQDMITHVFPLSAIREAMDTFINRRDGALKVVLNP